MGRDLREGATRSSPPAALLGVTGCAISGSGGNSVEHIVDSNTKLNYVPSAVATKINEAFLLLLRTLTPRIVALMSSRAL